MSQNISWRYYAVGSGIGSVASIVRCPLNDRPFWKLDPRDIQVLVETDVWQFQEAVYQKLMDDFCSGWFDEQANRIPLAELDAAIRTHINTTH